MNSESWINRGLFIRVSFWGDVKRGLEIRGQLFGLFCPFGWYSFQGLPFLCPPLISRWRVCSVLAMMNDQDEDLCFKLAKASLVIAPGSSFHTWNHQDEAQKSWWREKEAETPGWRDVACDGIRILVGSIIFVLLVKVRLRCLCPAAAADYSAWLFQKDLTELGWRRFIWWWCGRWD